MLLPTVLAIRTPRWPLTPDLYATSFSGRVVAILSNVMPTAESEMCACEAREAEVEDKR
jgi:hypothetical protein